MPSGCHICLDIPHGFCDKGVIMSTLRISKLVLLSLGSIAFAADPVITVSPDHPNGVYEAGEKVTWTVDVKGERTGLSALNYSVKKDGQVEVAKGQLDLTSGPATISASREEPGALLARIENPDKTNPKPLALGGALVAPKKIEPSAPAPADFDAFWQAKLKDLSSVPVNPVLEKVEGVKGAEGLDYYKVTLDNIRGTHVRGQLARPPQGDKFPAILVVQYAGVYPLQPWQVTSHARSGWLALNINAHDLPIDQSADFYKEQSAHALKDYIYQGSEDRETSYFLRMFLGCVRAVDYLTSRPDWDGKTLLVTGASQGGLQSFVTAGLCSKVTAVSALVPAGCDNYAPRANPPRAFGWPYWLSNWGPHDRDMKKVEKTAGYFDGINFAARIKCPTLIAVGLIDETSRPAGVTAAYNAIQSPDKELLIMPFSNHHGDGGAQSAYFSRFSAWMKALKAGQPVPPAGGSKL